MSITIISPGIYDFPEDFRSPVVEHGIYSNTCRRCGANINGHKYRRTCRVCVGILQRETEVLHAQGIGVAGEARSERSEDGTHAKPGAHSDEHAPKEEQD